MSSESGNYNNKNVGKSDKLNKVPKGQSHKKDNWYLKNKRAKAREALKQARRFQPHSGIETIGVVTKALTDMADFYDVSITDAVIRHAEGLTALLLNLQNCDSYQQFISATFLYVRDFFDSSVTSSIITYIGEIFQQDTITTQSGPIDYPDWLICIRNLQTNWYMARNNKAFSQFSKLLGILVTLGLCDASYLSFDIAGFKLFDEGVLKRHMSAFDLADALFGTITYFAEGAYLCFKTKSIQPLLLNDFSVMELDQEYVNMTTWWNLVVNGNLERAHGISDAEYSRRLDVVTMKLTSLMTTLTGIDKTLVTNKLIKCKTIKNDLITLKISSGTRRSPFAVELYGSSSQGKTTFGDQLLDALMISNDLPVGKEYRAALNPGDKFFSNWTSDKIVAILDDVANEKSNFVEKPPTRAIIDICNNQMYYAPKAELEAKGKCFVEPEVVLVTTNVKDLDAHAYSNCPYSVQRRMDLVYTVRCKPEFQRITNGKCCGVDSAKVRKFYTVDGVYEPPLIDEIWKLDLEIAIQPDRDCDVAHYAPVVWRGKIMTDVTPAEGIQCAVELMSEHRKNQIAIMDQARNRNSSMEKCKHEGCPHIHTMCPDHDFSKQFGVLTAVSLMNTVSKVKTRADKDATTFMDRLDALASDKLYAYTSKYLAKWDWICLIPSEYLENDNVQDFLVWYYGVSPNISYFRRFIVFALYVLIFFLGGYKISLSCIFIHITVGQLFIKSSTKATLMKELKTRNDTLPTIIKGTRDGYAKSICFSIGAIGALYALARLYRAYKSTCTENSALEPTSPEEIATRDAQLNVWATVAPRELPSTRTSQCSSLVQVENKVYKNLLYASVAGKGATMMANVVMLRSNVMLIPNHYFSKDDTLRLTCYKADCDKAGGTFSVTLSLDSSVLVPNTDFRICYCPNGGSYGDITKFLPPAEVVDHPFKITWRAKSGALTQGHGLAHIKKTTNGTIWFQGGDYSNLTMNTFAGMCGAALISETKAPVLTGFHLGGIANTNKGCFGTLTIGQVNASLIELNKFHSVLLTGSGEKFEPQMLGVNVMTNEPLHPKSPLNYLPPNTQFEYYGSCLGKTTSGSDVCQTPISEHVHEVCGVENIWGPPKMKPEWEGWQKCLANASDPGSDFPPGLLEKAVIDYKRPLLLIARKPEWQFTPLSDNHNLCGMPGVKFIDAINLNTSIGFPLQGKKRTYVTELEPTEDKPNNRVLDKIIMDEITRVEDLYRSGQRAYTIAKACKKDEILPVAKGKCRIFYGNPIVLTWLVRKYYLPVARLLQIHPLVSECTVGINCHGPEWDELYKHMTKYGQDRLFGGDYGKYDQKLPSQVLLAALRILIDIAREMGYDEESLNIMASMAGDIVYSLVAFNGDLIGLQNGMHISGNPLTVILNSVGGSLNLRTFFYSVYDSNIEFRSAAAMGTYGDDNMGSVHADYPKFNIKDCSEFLASYGQIYTMPDKESALTDYLKPEDFEFLKRTSVYHPKLGVHVGALLESSVFKSLHCYMRTKGHPLTPEQACALNIDTSLREWFNHGEEVYEQRRKDMTLVADRGGIRHLCTLLDETYDDRVANWRYSYVDGEEKSEPPAEEYTFQSGYEEVEKDTFDDICEAIPMSCLGRNLSAFDPTIGEIDLIFESLIEGVRYLVIVEVKASTNNTCKGRKQLKKYYAAMRILQPKARILAMLVTPNGWTPVCMSPSELSGWFSISDRAKDGRFQLALALAALDA